MARLPTIAARAPPRRKTSSSHPTSQPAAATHNAVTKAAKRSAKRSKVLSAPSGETTTSTAERHKALGIAPTISKSALRRRKRKLRDEAVLGQGGLEEIKGQLEELDSNEDDDDEEERAVDEGLVADYTTPAASMTQATRPASEKVGSKLRKRVLAQESMRQPFILKDLYSTQQQASGTGSATSTVSVAPAPSPFAAIRRHAQNSLGLTASNPAATQGGDTVM
ncbi:hypothetical protein BCV69DRAFT_281104, partial [Microstroma glucosiphilum]